MQRFPQDAAASLDDFRRSAWKEAVAASDGSCYGMWQSLSGAARTAIESDDPSVAKILWLLADACSLRLVPQSLSDPFRTAVVHANGRSASTEDFKQDDVKLLAEIAGEMPDGRLRARLADLAWLLIKPRNPSFALLAIDTYRGVPLDIETFIQGGKESWERAIALCRMLGKGCGTRLDECEAGILSAFENATGADGFLALWLTELLAETNLGRERSGGIAEKLAEMARYFEGDGNLHRARMYAEASIRWCGRADKQEKALEMTAFLAETWAREAMEKATANVPSNAMAASLYELAIQIYRGIPRKHRGTLGVESRLNELHRLMSDAGESSISEMGRVYSEGANISELIQRSVNEVSGKELLEALRAFTSMSVPSIAQRRERAEKMLRDTPLRGLFASSHIHSDGRVIAKVAGANFNDPDSAEHKSAVWAEMLTHYRIEVQVAVQGVIWPGFEVLVLEHRMNVDVFVELAYRSPVVPRGRELLFAKGIIAGFERDFAAALHLLVPQVENLVRWHLKAAGIRTTTLDAGGIETENGLSSLMDIPQTTRVFGEELSFELKAVFCDSLGANLRNELAHGLLDFEDCLSMWSTYAWWLVLRLMLMSFWNSQRRDPAQQTPDASSVGSPE